MHNVMIETSRTGHAVYVLNAAVPGGVAYLGPISLVRGDAFDVIPKALRRAELAGYAPSPHVELRRFGGERVAAANAAFAAACDR